MPRDRHRRSQSTSRKGGRFQPANITFDLLPPLDDETRRKVRDKRERHRIQCERALAACDAWLGSNAILTPQLQ